MPASTFYLLLIGADGYFPNELSSGATYPSLRGCVSDVTRIEAMLRQRLAGHALDVSRLVAPAGANALPTGDPALWPTAANIRAKLAGVAERAQPGDQVYLHYSGHGGRVTTASKALKGNHGVDEALVPIDIGLADDPDGPIYTRPERYIRDVELALYLDRLAHKRDGERRVTVTLVFDSCHSGGVTRGVGDLAKRSALGGRPSADDPTGTLDCRELDETGAAAAQRAAMAAAYARLRSSISSSGPASGPSSMTRSAAPAQTSWLPPAEGYVLLAACRDVESALECSFDGKPRGGVLTGALLEALDKLGSEQSWQTVYDRVLAHVHGLFASQTPQLLGDIDRHVFGVDLLPVPHTLAVTRIDAGSREVTISGGLALTITKGTQLGIYAPGVTDFARLDQRVAILTIRHADPLEARGTLEAGVDLAKIELGAPVVIHARPLRRKVELLPRVDLPAEVAAQQPAALAAVAAAIARDADGFLEITTSGETPHYQVALSADAQFEICDPQGQPFRYLEPTIAVDAPDAASAVTAQLRRLGHYHTVLGMAEPASALRDQLTVELLVAPAEWSEDAPVPAIGGTPLVRTGDAYTVPTETWIWLRLTNQQPRNPLNIALLDLGRTWEIDMIVPDPSELAGKRYETIADKPQTFAFKMYTPVPEAIDVFKLFITAGDVDFRALTTTGRRTRSAGEPRTRDAARARPTSWPWTVREFRMRTVLRLP